MPLTKQYLKYIAGDCFGVICSRKAGALLLEKHTNGGRRLQAVAPSLERVIIWDLKTGEKVSVLHDESHDEVTVLCKTRDTNQDKEPLLSVGYEDGSVRIWSLVSCDCHVTFNGHKTAVTSLHFDSSNTRLVSGGKDTDLIIWDVIGETGLYRLKGHKGPITCCRFMDNHNVLISCSKDTVCKLWDLDTQHCFHTVVGHRSEVWGVCLVSDESRLVTASSDKDLRILELVQSTDERTDSIDLTKPLQEGPVLCKVLGTIGRSVSGRVFNIQTDQYKRHIAVLSGENTIEIYRVRNEEELKKKIHKKMKKKAKKNLDQSTAGTESDSAVELSVADEIHLLHTFHSKSKIKYCDIKYTPDTDEIMLLLTMHNNSLELHSLSPSDSSSSGPAHPSMYSITHPGHRSDIRTVCISSSGSLMASGSSDMVKIWKTSGSTCINTLASGYAVSSCFIPGDRYLLIGTKSGDINLFEVSSGLLLDSFSAHSKAVWSVSVSPDRRGFISGSADHDVKFWEFELINDTNHNDRKRLTAVHVKTLKMSEDVLCVKYSPNQKLLAVALMDSTVKLFYVDTLKFFLSLYGHKLPVLSMDISTDNTLIVTASADKNIKIWGMDFGDCHRSIHAHDDSIMGVQFVPKTHLIFSVSKDKTLKYWDGDKYEHIQTLKGHHGEVWCLYISPDGNTVVTGSHDLSLRMWECTHETLVLSEERENEREAEFDKAIAETNEPVIPGEDQDGEVSMAGKKTTETVQGAERIMEALEIYQEEAAKIKEHEEEYGGQAPAVGYNPHPILKAFGSISPDKYVLSVVCKIKSSDLEKSLVVIPFAEAVQFMKLCSVWLQKEWEVELTCRCLFFLLRLHHQQIITSDVLVDVMGSLYQHTVTAIDSVRDVYGFNLAGMRHLEHELKDSKMAVFKNVSVTIDSVRKRKRKKL